MMYSCYPNKHNSNLDQIDLQIINQFQIFQAASA